MLQNHFINDRGEILSRMNGQVLEKSIVGLNVDYIDQAWTISSKSDPTSVLVGNVPSGEIFRQTSPSSKWEIVDFLDFTEQ